MEHNLHLKNSFPELFLALSLDYVYDFKLKPDGTLVCSSYPVLAFDISEVRITSIYCSLQNATLYLINTKGILLRGTLVEYHEM